MTSRSSTLTRWGAVGLLLASAGVARGADLAPGAQPATSPYGWLEEVRFGAADHNAFLTKERPGGFGDVDGLAEAISRPLPFYATDNTLLRAFLDPRAVLGSTFSFHGETSILYGGLLWRVPLAGPVFAEAEFGGALNNAPHGVVPGRIDMACPTTFHESIGFGIELTPHIDLVADVEHSSHAYLCGRQNPGLTNVGLKLGYKF